MTWELRAWRNCYLLEAPPYRFATRRCRALARGLMASAICIESYLVGQTINVEIANLCLAYF